MKRIVFLILATIGSYLLTAFIFWSINPASWSGWGRVCFLFFLLWAICWAFMLSERKKAYSDFMQNRKKTEKEFNQN